MRGLVHGGRRALETFHPRGIQCASQLGVERCDLMNCSRCFLKLSGALSYVHVYSSYSVCGKSFSTVDRSQEYPTTAPDMARFWSPWPIPPNAGQEVERR